MTGPPARFPIVVLDQDHGRAMHWYPDTSTVRVHAYMVSATGDTHYLLREIDVFSFAEAPLDIEDAYFRIVEWTITRAREDAES